MKILLCYLLLLFPLVLPAQQKAPSDTLYFKDIRQARQQRGGLNFSINYGMDDAYLWRYSNQDSAAFAGAIYDDSGWPKQLSFLSETGVIEKKIKRGISWFRLSVVVDTVHAAHTSVLLFKGTGAAEVYLDGELMARLGNISDTGQNGYIRFASQPVFLPAGSPGIHTLAIRYKNDLALRNGDTWGFSITAENPDVFLDATKNNQILTAIALLGVGTLFFTLFFVHFLLFAFYRKESSNLYFALFNLSIAILLYLVYYAFNADREISDGYANVILMASSCIVVCFSMSAFTSALFARKKTFLKIIALLSLVTLICSVIDILYDTALSDVTMYLLLALSIGYTLVKIIVAIYRKTPGSLILGFGILFCASFILTLIINLIFTGSLSITGWLFLYFVLAIFSIPISISSFLAWRSANTNKNLSKQLITVEQLSKEKQSILENQKEELEKEVNIRTEEVLQQKKEIEEEKKKSDNLLLNILPQEIAEELKEKGASKAQQYDEVSVIFTDFVNFTQISEQLGVDELLNELNINFTAFDRIMEKYGLEKIKTIGDAYLAVGGLPVADPQHAQNAVRAALDIIDFVSERKQQVPYGLDIRIGINSGSLIAGIIGVKKFAYDIWGDTVNTAARMEQSSMPGKINISEHTFQLIKEEFSCTHRGKIEAKNKGAVDMYFVNKPDPAHAR